MPMRAIQDKATKFLKQYSMDYQSIRVPEYAERFVQEMRCGLEGGSGSLRMIPTFLSPVNRPKTGEPVIVLDAGGTHFRVAVVSFDQNYLPSVEKCQIYRMPGTDDELESDVFFSRIAEMILPVADQSDTISFCFSYACQPTPDRDGIIAEIGKQLRVKGLVGKKLGSELNKALQKAGCREEKRVVVLNDSVATLLGGVLAAKDRRYDSYIGFILGTGLNASYVEKGGNIPRLSVDFCGQKLIINTESGNYDGFPSGQLDDAYDATLLDPGTWRYEKMVSGRYQGGLALTVIRQAAHDGLLSAGFCRQIKSVKELTSSQLDEFLDQPDGDNLLAHCCDGINAQDTLTVFYLADALAERAGKLVAANLAALMLKTGSGKNPLCPGCITADGSTFYKSRLFRKKLDYYVKQSLADEMGLYCEFNRVEDVNLLGSAVAGLCI